MRDLKLVVVLVSVLIAIAACGGPAANNSATNNGNKTVAVTNGNSAPVAANNSNSPATAKLDGKELYTQSCKICHQDTGKGGPTTIDGKKIKPSDLTNDKMKNKHTDDDIAKDISEGSPDDGMPAFKEKLKPEEIKAIVGYIRTLQQQ